MSTLGGNRTDAFERVVLPHLDAAYTLARWLTRNEDDASDVVQEASLRALKFVDGYRGENGRAWFLSIVRNTSYTLLKARNSKDEPLQDDAIPMNMNGASDSPEAVVMKNIDVQLLRDAIEELPVEFREVIILRELQELSYDEVARVAGIPIGTVMSRLARARGKLVERLTRQNSRSTHGV